jgi:hypothetical protein
MMASALRAGPDAPRPASTQSARPAAPLARFCCRPLPPRPLPLPAACPRDERRSVGGIAEPLSHEPERRCKGCT